MQFWYISAQKDSDIIVHFIPTSKLPLPIPKLYTIATQKKTHFDIGNWFP